MYNVYFSNNNASTTMHSYATVFSFVNAVNAINNTIKAANSNACKQFDIVQQVRNMEQAIYDGELLSKKQLRKFERACMQYIAEVTQLSNEEVKALAEYITQTIWMCYCPKKYSCSTLIMLSKAAQNDLVRIVNAYYNYRNLIIS